MIPRAILKQVGGGLLVLPAPAWAAVDAVGSLLTVLLALALILGGFIALAWFARRYLPGMATQGVVKVVGATNVGPRERVVVVEVAETWVVLGVGGGNVRLLHSLPKPGLSEPSLSKQGTVEGDAP